LLTPRRLAKGLAEWGAVRSGLAGSRIARDPSSVAILAYHNVVPRGESAVGDLSAHLPQEEFGRQLDVLARTHDVVTLTQAVGTQPTEGRRPSVVITFDDAYQGAVTAGFEELEKRGLPATMFVPPGLLGSEGFWWDRVATARDAPLDSDVREFALGALEGRQEHVLHWARQENLLLRDLPSHARPATAASLVRAAESANVALAPHTWSHPNLRALPGEEAQDEVERSRRWVADHVSGDVERLDWLAYPYGLWSDAAASIVDDTMSGGLLVSGGLARKYGRWVGGRPILPRILVPCGLSTNGLLLRLADLVGG